MAAASSPAGSELDLCSAVAGVRVSSVLDGNGPVYGKQHLLDGKEETCWSSAQGRPQHVTLRFARPVCVSRVAVAFQGGFVGKPCKLLVGHDSAPEWREVGVFEAADESRVQSFEIKSESNAIARLQLFMPDSTDLFGRVIIYRLQVFGRFAGGQEGAAAAPPAEGDTQSSKKSPNGS